MEYQDELERMKTRRLRQKQTESRRESESRYMGDNHPYDGQKRYQGDNRSYEWQNSSGDSLSYGRQDRRADNNHFYNERGSRPDSRRSYDRQNVNKPYGRSTLGMTESEAGRWYAKNGSGQGYPQRNRKSMAGSTKKKSRLKKKIRIFFLEVIFLFLLLGSVFFYIQKKTEKGVWTVAVFGVDSREGSLEKDTHSDVEMLCVLDRETGELRIVSVFRDTYLQVNSEGKYHKINQAYFDGGHTQAVEALNTNLDLQIDDYATFNWKAVADAITILGGIDLEITDSEFNLNP